MDGLIDLPFALPTAVAGIALTTLYAENGFLGSFLYSIGIQSAFSPLGITIALIFVGIPFVARSVQPVLKELDPQLEEAANVFGASNMTIFGKVIFPELVPPLLTGFALAFARGIGEYGSVIYSSVNSAKNGTQVVSYVIMQKLNYMDYASATSIALILLIISFLMLLFINMVQVRQSRRTNNV